jgi:hypothetical protein
MFNNGSQIYCSAKPKKGFTLDSWYNAISGTFDKAPKMHMILNEYTQLTAHFNENSILSMFNSIPTGYSILSIFGIAIHGIINGVHWLRTLHKESTKL